MPPKPKIDKLKLHKMLQNGKSQKEVAQVFGVSEGAVSKAVKGCTLVLSET